MFLIAPKKFNEPLDFARDKLQAISEGCVWVALPSEPVLSPSAEIRLNSAEGLLAFRFGSDHITLRLYHLQLR